MCFIFYFSLTESAYSARHSLFCAVAMRRFWEKICGVLILKYVGWVQKVFIYGVGFTPAAEVFFSGFAELDAAEVSVGRTAASKCLMSGVGGY